MPLKQAVTAMSGCSLSKAAVYRLLKAQAKLTQRPKPSQQNLKHKHTALLGINSSTDLQSSSHCFGYCSKLSILLRMDNHEAA